MFHDLRYGLRMLLKRPAFTLIAVLSLALGIGAAAIFSLLDAVLLKSLPVQAPDKLVLFGNGKNMGATTAFPNESRDLFSFYSHAQQPDVRMALGARGRSVLWLVSREALTLVVIGLVIGVLTSLAVTKTAASLLYELKPNDPLTIALATLLLAGVAALAGYLPARRAARVDPMVALRDE